MSLFCTLNLSAVFEKKDKIVLVLDYAQGGELYEYLNKMGKLSESEARRIFRQIVSAVHYCHQVTRIVPAVTVVILHK